MSREPERIWLLSTKMYSRGHTRLAKALKALNYVAFRAILPIECDVANDVRLLHRGLGVVIHPRTTIGRGVIIGHGVTLSAGADEISRVTVGDGVFIASGVTVATGNNRSVSVGQGSELGLGTVITRDVPPRSRVRAPRPNVQSLSQ